ncbi:6-phosphofructokinase [Pseudoalteromonas sp.]|uniref:6-phosphofructokinase n=1 Tax=Pseudoalteromonas sp. TaxID=53249 RepID=UPI0026094744|nr:6-phosphofructokinase [Pseudoalteromonas sp.]MCP4588765.1 hypothetical protein [Pseudoalteromonas sp.]
MNKKGNLLVLMSGGTSTVINSTLVGLVKEVKSSAFFDKIYAGVPGVQGVLLHNLIELSGLSDYELEKMKNTPGSEIIGTTRISFLNGQEMEQLYSVFSKLNIIAFVNIGGNGTIKQTKSIAAAMPADILVAAAPKTVDNDLGDTECNEMLFTPGFPSCVNHWARLTELLNIENAGACSHDQVLIAQTFGRDTGFLAGAARIADQERQMPLLLLLPEDQRSIEEIVTAIENKISRDGRALIIMSEGYVVGDVGVVKDASGQIMYGSSRTTSAQLLNDQLIKEGLQSRTCIPTIIQRQCLEDRLSFDLDIAEKLGSYIVKKLIKGDSGFLASVKKGTIANKSSSLSHIDFDSFDDLSRKMPEDFINKGCFDVSDKYIEYLNSFFEVSSFEKKYKLRKSDFLYRKDIFLK